MISSVFIRRPILATVMSLMITLGGLLAMANLPVSQYPDLLPVTIQISASYTGASPEVISDTVAAPLEQQVNGVEGMLYMQSTSSSDGSYSLMVYFDSAMDPDMCTVNVTNRVQAALPMLPEEVRRTGVLVSKSSSAILLMISMFSPDGTVNIIDVANYAAINVVDDLKRVDGVGDAVIFDAKDYTMRVWLKPDVMASLGVSPAEVNAAIQEQNAQFAAGRIGQEPLEKPVEIVYMVQTKGRLSTVEEFGNIVLRANQDGSILRLKDVADIELGAQMYDFQARYNDRDAIALAVFLTPGANALNTADLVQKHMETISENFPDGISYDIPYNTTTFVRISIEEVVKTLVEALVLVFLVVFLFIQDLRATIIPIVAVPVSIVGTFAGMYLFGFSINTLTLFGMVLAIGIVVDDAIVVLENVDRIMEQDKLQPHAATEKAMREVTGPVIAIVLVLCSVFVPVAFLGGLAGAMYRQFAVTIAVSVAISGFVALTLTPALCALLLKTEIKPLGGFFSKFNAWFKRRTNNYITIVTYLIHHRKTALLIMVVIFSMAILLFKVTPESLVPDEDQGYIISSVIMPDGASLSRVENVTAKLEEFLQKQELVDKYVILNGFDLMAGALKSNSGAAFIMLKPWDERTGKEESTFDFVHKMNNFASTIPEAIILNFNPPPISGMSNTGGFELYLQSRGDGSSQEMAHVAKLLTEEAAKHKQLAGVTSTFSANVPQLYVDLNREQAKMLGIPINSVFSAMQAVFGSQYVNDFNLYGRTYKVMTQAKSEYRARPDHFSSLYLQSQDGKMIPLTSIVNIIPTEGPDLINRFNIFNAAHIVGGPAEGYSSGQALDAMEEVADKILVGDYADYEIAWTGSAYQERATGGSSSRMLLLGLLMVFLILAAQYEKWTLPIAVICAVPFAAFGAIAATFLRGLDNDIYLQIALLTLVGLSAKNAILIVEFALMHWESGTVRTPGEAAIHASGLRFRPIIMTSLAFVLGCLPLAISTGAGAASRHAIGTGVIGGMLASTFIATIFVPLFFTVVIESSERFKAGFRFRLKKHLENEPKEEKQ